MTPAWTFTSIAEAHMRRRCLDARAMLGAIPAWLSTVDPAGAIEQIDRAYRPIGGGWRDSDVGRLTLDVARGLLTYPGDPPRQLIASAQLRDERILFFDGAWIAVVQPDGSHRVARID